MDTITMGKSRIAGNDWYGVHYHLYSSFQNWFYRDGRHNYFHHVTIVAVSNDTVSILFQSQKDKDNGVKRQFNLTGRNLRYFMKYALGKKTIVIKSVCGKDCNSNWYAYAVLKDWDLL